MGLRIHLVSLGCARTLVDSEVALGDLVGAGHVVARDLDHADVAVVNTCGFIEEAKAESIDAILSLCRMKKEGRLQAVVVLGCLAQRHGEILRKELNEVDAIIGTNNFGDISKILASLGHGSRKAVAREKIYKVEPKPYYLLDENTPRYSLTPGHYAYVKISEGCINACSYCAIPRMKGAHRSRSVDSVIAEIRAVTSQRKISEINLIGQDTAAYGYDRGKQFLLPELLRAIDREKRAPWIRLLYAHPGHVTGDMIDVIAASSSICKYIDFPVEHSHDSMLKRMNRGVDRAKMLWGIGTIRKRIPNACIRTTVIVGFPGETDEEFRDLMDFLKDVRFEKLGAFEFSREEGTRAWGMPNPVPKKICRERYDAVMSQQRQISEKMHREKIGQTIRVLIDEKSTDGDGVFYGRTEFDAPDVDGQVIVHSKIELVPGQFIDSKITDALEYDLVVNFE